MGFEADEEILQDFLVEAGEILEQLSEQLVSLEQNPEDSDLLNAIFRGFHTVKGGAGFLQLDALVGCCHIAENVFDILRTGKRSVDSELMDVVLRALDSVNEMFDEVRNGQDPTAADPQLLKELEQFALPESEVAADNSEAAQEEASVEETTSAKDAEIEEISGSDSDGDITDDEFENLLDALDSPEQAEATASDTQGKEDVSVEAAGDNNDISDDEFEQLLNELHGEGQPISTETESKPASTSPEPEEASNSKDITDNEFEKLLDDLHGKGQFDSNAIEAVDEQATAKVEESPVQKSKDVEPEPAAKVESIQAQSPVEAKPPANAAPSKSESVKKPVQAKSKAAPRNESIATETTVRVDTKRLDDIMNMVGELVLVRNRLKRLGDVSGEEDMQKAVSNLDVVTGDLQSAVMQTRMQPIKKVFGRFPRVVRDLARNMKKEINLVLVGEDTDLDKNLVEALSDPLVHLVRNAVDHGIEMPDEREAAGKSRIGQVVLSAQQEGDHILLTIEDDGAGMDANVLRAKAIEKGLYDEDNAERLTDTECYNLIFAPGFSTKVEISDVSGRGVGMDVVKTKIAQLNGTVSIDSTLGKGSRLIIKVPLTLAIMPTLMVKLSDQAFAFPLVSVVEIFHLDLTKTNVVDGQECVVVRDNVYPLFYIKRWLINANGGAEDFSSAHVVIVAVGTQRVGFIVDQLVGQEEVVIKPLGGMLHGTPGMAGATITGDGRIALILDVPSLLQRYA